MEIHISVVDQIIGGVCDVKPLCDGINPHFVLSGNTETSIKLDNNYVVVGGLETT